MLFLILLSSDGYLRFECLFHIRPSEFAVYSRPDICVHKLELALWSRCREDGPQLEGLRFDPHMRRKLFNMSEMDVVE